MEVEVDGSLVMVDLAALVPVGLPVEAVFGTVPVPVLVPV